MRKLLVVLLSLAGLASGCTAAGDAGSPAEGPVEVGSIAPAFKLPSAEGGPVSLEDHRGRPVLLYFSMGPG